MHDPEDKEWKEPNKMVDIPGGDRNITKAYVSDKDGNPSDESSYITLELQIIPDEALSSALYSDGLFASKWAVCKFKITQQKDFNITTDKSNVKAEKGSIINNSTGQIRKVVDEFKTGSFTNSKDNITLTYSDYTPQSKSEKKPLIIWLHGMGEGGTDATIPIAGNKACNFATEEIQSYFNGAYVLAPQCPTYWMQSPTRPLGDGLGTDSFGDGTSIYEDALYALIKEYVSKHDDIDPNRIYLGGDSNGGYMAMLLARDYGSYFAAVMTASEALNDSSITDEQIQKMKDIPMWFVAAKTDGLVPVETHEQATYNRLVKAGAKDVHFTLFDKVADTTGLYKDAKGQPYEYSGHSSWIYLYNNEVQEEINGKTVTMMEWLASKTK